MFNFDPNDPRKYGLMQMALALMGNKSPNLGQAVGQAGLMGMQGYQQQRAMNAREKEEQQQAQMREMQMEQARQAQTSRQGLMSAYNTAFNQPNLNQVSHGDDGMPIPQVQGGGGLPEFLKLGGQYMDPMQAVSMMTKQDAPMILAEGARAVGRDGRVIAENPKDVKPDGPKMGQTREIKHGGNILTYEWDGKDWKKIASAPQFKPDGPEKPDKPQFGWRYRPDGSLEPVPGGPADAKAGAQAEALAKREQGALTRVEQVLGKVDEAIKKVGPTTTGALGSFMGMFPGSGSRDLKRALDPIKANIGFAELQAMREASPTGGALGQVAVKELDMLQSVLGSLEQDQTEDQLLNTLNKIHRHYNNWRLAVQQSKQQPQAGGFKYLGTEP